jgi:hypothetical protein
MLPLWMRNLQGQIDQQHAESIWAQRLSIKRTACLRCGVAEKLLWHPKRGGQPVCRAHAERAGDLCPAGTQPVCVPDRGGARGMGRATRTIDLLHPLNGYAREEQPNKPMQPSPPCGDNIGAILAARCAETSFRSIDAAAADAQSVGPRQCHTIFS